MVEKTTLGPQDVIASVGAFSHLPDVAREALREVTSLRRYRKDAYVFTEGEDAEFLCFLLDGAVRTFHTSAAGNERTLQLTHPGEVFAVSGLFGRETHPVTAQTLQPSYVGFIPNTALRALVQRRPDISWALLELFGQRLRDLQAQAYELSSRDAAGKLAAALLRLAQEAGEPRGSEVQLQPRLTHRELAQLIGCSRETVTRILREFREDRSVELDMAGHLLVRPQRLQAYAN